MMSQAFCVMENKPQQSPLKTWAYQIIGILIFVLLGFIILWLYCPLPGSADAMPTYFFTLAFILWAFYVLKSTMTLVRISFNTIPVNCLEFPANARSEFVCEFPSAPANSVLIVQLGRARRTEFIFEIYESSRSVIQKAIRTQNAAGPMGGMSPAHFTFTFKQMPSWATGIRLRVKPLKTVPLDSTWITGRVFMRSSKHIK